VAKEAIQEASRNGSDVVLVDTAGRMQVIIAVVVEAKVYWFYGGVQYTK
jgi:signal recognition particle GTPase